MNIKDAVRLATSFMVESYPEDVSASLTLEEVSLDEAGEIWLVTLSLVPGQALVLSDQMTGRHGSREYKVVQVRREDGEVLGMKTKH